MCCLAVCWVSTKLFTASRLMAENTGKSIIYPNQLVHQSFRSTVSHDAQRESWGRLQHIKQNFVFSFLSKTARHAFAHGVCEWAYQPKS